jgi:hypothetical protein
MDALRKSLKGKKSAAQIGAFVASAAGALGGFHRDEA